MSEQRYVSLPVDLLVCTAVTLAVALPAGLAALPHFEPGTLAHAVLYGTTGTSIVAVLNLIPFRLRLESRSGSEVVASDGRQLFDALFAYWALRRR